MDTLTELINYIVTKMNYAGEDVDVFRHILPGEPSEATCVVQYGGAPTPLFAEASEKRYQIQIRSKTHAKAYDKAIKLQKVLRDSSTAYIKLDTMDCPISLLDHPFKLQIDERNRVVYAFNISITSIN